MKKYVILFAMLATTFALGAQVKMVRDEFPSYQGVVEVKGLESKFIYSDFKVWYTNQFKLSNKTIQQEDPERARNIYRGSSPINFSQNILSKNEGQVFFILTLDAKDERFRFTIEVLDVIMKDGKSMKDEILRSPGKSTSRLARGEIDKVKQELINSLGRIEESSSSNW